MRRIARSLVVVLLFGLYQYVTPYSAMALLTQPPSSNLTVGSGACLSDVADNSVAAVEVVNVTNYCVLKFKSGNNSWTAPTGVNNIWLLVVGGGGTGGYGRGGGGGAGGMYENTNFAVSNQSYSITVAATKTAGASFSGAGNQSVFGALTVNGGGGGGSHLDPTPVPFTTSGTPNSLTGASGGGSGMNYVNYSNGGGTASVTAETNVSANAGANSASTGNAERNTGGGGGAGGAGVAGSGGTTSATGGTSPNGGAGKASSITGTSIFYAAGGGGASGITGAEYQGSYTTALAGSGGSSIGGNGERVTALNTSTAATSGAANTGSGGGGGVSAGGNGGSGVVIIRWIPVAQTSSPASVSIPDSHTITLSYFETTTSGLTVTRQWQSSTNGTSWSNVSGGSGANTDTYTTNTLYLSQTGIQFRGSTTFSDGTLSSTRYTSAATITVFAPPGSDTDTALLSSATSGYAWTKDNSALDISSAITLEAWVYPTAFTQSAWNVVINKGASYEIGITSSNGTTGTWNYAFASSSSGLTSSVNTAIPVALNEWHHVAVTRGANLATADFYLDGVKVYSGTADGASTSGLYNSAYPFAIGARTSDGVTFTGQFKGQIDHAMVFNSARTSAEILADMNSYSVSNSTELRAYYDFNEGSETIIYNRVVGSPAETSLTSVSSQSWPEVKITDTTTLPVYTIVKFPRTYLTSIGGWRVPAGIPKVSAVVIAGGGGGGSRAAGGGGAGGYVYIPVLTLTPNAVESITVGQGGVGGNYSGVISNYQGINGQNSQLGSRYTTAGGGGGGGALGTNTYRSGANGGSGGGASGNVSGGNSSAAYGTSTQSGYGYGLGNRGGSGIGGDYWNGGGGGGSGGPGSHSSTSSWAAGNGGAGTLDPISGSSQCLAAGGGGGTIEGGVSAGTGGTCTGGTSTAGAGTIGSITGYTALANSGSGGGGSGYSNGADKPGGNGGSGLIAFRWITATKPTYTKPVNAYLNVGMTETFTTNVAQDSATVILARTFKWESTTPTANGAYTLIKQGTGAANAAFSWVPTDTRTSGSSYLFRLTVTDSDTAGLSISDSSTAYAVINGALTASGLRTITKTVNIGKSETYTITLGTGPYQISWLGTEPKLRLETVTASSIILKVSDTATIGTYYETITVIDSVSAVLTIPLIVKVVPVPSILWEGALVARGLVLDYQIGNSQSLLGTNGQATTGITLRDLSGRQNDATTGGTFSNVVCAAPTYSSSNGGALSFGSGKCYYTPYNGDDLRNHYTAEVWFKKTGSFGLNSYLVSQRLGTADYTSISIGTMGNMDQSLRVGFYYNGLMRSTSCGYIPTLNEWTHIAGTYDGVTLRMYINGQLLCSENYTNLIPDALSNPEGIMIGAAPNSGNIFINADIASVRLYGNPLTSYEIADNYHLSKTRFKDGSNYLVSISKKYGSVSQESFTIVSGTDVNTVSFAIGSRSGIIWDSSTSISRIKLNLQESSTIGTYLETITVTDANGSATMLPLIIDVTVADSLTVTMDTATTTFYNGTRITSYPKPTIRGLVWQDTATTVSRFSSALYAESTLAPINADTYTVRGAEPTFTVGSLSNYAGIVYEESTATINKINQRPLQIFMYGGTVGLPYLIWLQGGDGTGDVSETLTGLSSLSGCSISNHYLSAQEEKQGFCEVRVVKSGDQNYFAETQTVQMYFMAYVNNQPTGQVGSGSTIAINGVTSFETSTVTPPSITSFNLSSAAALTSIEINGSGFSQPGLVIKFNRNKIAGTPSSLTDSKITVTIPLGATTGRVVVITQNGEAVSPESLTITP